MATKAPEILVNECRIQEGVKTYSQTTLQAMTIGMEVIQVILEADPFSSHLVWVKKAGHEAATLLF